MATNPDQDEFLEDDGQDEIARRSIFSAGWFRALLVLTVLAIIVVVSLPYLLNWLEPTPPPAKVQAKSTAPAPAPGPALAPPAPTPSTPALAPAPTPSAPPAAPAKAATPIPPAPVPPPTKAPEPKAAPAPPAPAAKAAEPKPAAPVPAVPSPAERAVGTAPPLVVPSPPAPAAKSAAGVQSGAVAKSAPATPPAPAAQPTPGTQPAPAARAEAPKATPAPKPSGAAEGVSSGGYWVQVGAFTEERNAQALAKQLRGENFTVQVSTVTRGDASAPAKTPGGQNQLFITGSTPDAVNAALKGKGTAQAVKGGVQVSPSFDLETATSLSSSLKKDGFKVVIRRAREATPKAAAGGGTTYHVVRVGGYPDRTKAQQARGDLQAKGHAGFLTQGAAR